MQKYNYSIRLRIWHPSIHPDVISKTLQIGPNNIFIVGEPRRTPKGALLEGTYNTNYWSAYPSDVRDCFSGDVKAEDSLNSIIEALQNHTSFFGDILASGGKALLEICSYGNENYAFVFPPKLLKKCVAANLSLVVDVYPVQQNW